MNELRETLKIIKLPRIKLIHVLTETTFVHLKAV